jgi:hypothetical protein
MELRGIPIDMRSLRTIIAYRPELRTALIDEINLTAPIFGRDLFRCSFR